MARGARKVEIKSGVVAFNRLRNEKEKRKHEGKRSSSYATLEKSNIKVRVVEVLGDRQREGRKEGRKG